MSETNTGLSQSGALETTPRRLGVPLRIVLYVALAGSAVMTFAGLPLLQQRVEALGWSPLWLLAPAACFGLFLTVFVADRVWQLKFRHYPAGRALYQIVFGLLFLLLLLPSSVREYRSVVSSRPPRHSLAGLMAHRDRHVRAIACELAGYRPRSPEILRGLGQALTDKDEKVRATAQASLLRLTGQSFEVGLQGQLAVFELVNAATAPEAEDQPATP